IPVLGRISSPVPNPVSVTRYFTGKFALASGNEPQLGLPPGPPLACTRGKLSGKRYGSSPKSSPPSMLRDLPLPPMAARPPFSRYHTAPSKVHLGGGEDLFRT